MCGCNKPSNKWSSTSCKKYKERLTKSSIKLKILLQSSQDASKKEDYTKMINEIGELLNANNCPKISVINAVENYIKNEQNQ